MKQGRFKQNIFYFRILCLLCALFLPGRAIYSFDYNWHLGIYKSPMILTGGEATSIAEGTFEKNPGFYGGGLPGILNSYYFLENLGFEAAYFTGPVFAYSSFNSTLAEIYHLRKWNVGLSYRRFPFSDAAYYFGLGQNYTSILLSSYIKKNVPKKYREKEAKGKGLYLKAGFQLYFLSGYFIDVSIKYETSSSDFQNPSEEFNYSCFEIPLGFGISF